MSSAVASSLGIVAYLALFAAVGLLFIFVNLLIGRFVRPSDPNEEKLEIYECGEPTIGSSYVQFDLRFYVVALLFIIFDVEVAFFFPMGYEETLKAVGDIVRRCDCATTCVIGQSSQGRDLWMATGSSFTVAVTAVSWCWRP